jgi:hypothetical protein
MTEADTNLRPVVGKAQKGDGIQIQTSLCYHNPSRDN